MTPWLLVSGDFVPLGGMDSANHGLALYLAHTGGRDVHLVAHRVADGLANQPHVHAHLVKRPFAAHTLGEPLLRAAALRLASDVRSRGGHVIANGGNVDAGDVTWVHYLHAAYEPSSAGSVRSLIASTRHAKYLREERRALEHARLVICNSDRTVQDVVQRIGIEAGRVRRVYYGCDVGRFRPGDPSEAKRQVGWAAGRLAALFAGALGDRRKAFDTVIDAWTALCGTPEWDVDLYVAGSGAELPAWRARVAADRVLESRVHFLGYRDDMPTLLRAADLVVHPARYEAYGLSVHEALCTGVPAIVTSGAGVAERVSDPLRALLLQDPDSAAELRARLLAWRADVAGWRTLAGALGDSLRARTWADMAREIVDLVEA